MARRISVAARDTASILRSPCSSGRVPMVSWCAPL